MRLRHLLLPLLAAPLLSACVNDGATYEIDNTREHVLSLIREQPYFWDSKVNLYLVVSRMPACMRRHSWGPAPKRPGSRSTRCRPAPSSSRQASGCLPPRRRPARALPRWTASRPEGMGKLMGTFRLKKGELVFVKEEGDEAAAGE
jgi:hypothetical protein